MRTSIRATPPAGEQSACVHKQASERGRPSERERERSQGAADCALASTDRLTDRPTDRPADSLVAACTQSAMRRWPASSSSASAWAARMWAVSRSSSCTTRCAKLQSKAYISALKARRLRSTTHCGCERGRYGGRGQAGAVGTGSQQRGTLRGGQGAGGGKQRGGDVRSKQQGSCGGAGAPAFRSACRLQQVGRGVEAARHRVSGSSRGACLKSGQKGSSYTGRQASEQAGVRAGAGAGLTAPHQRRPGVELDVGRSRDVGVA